MKQNLNCVFLSIDNKAFLQKEVILIMETFIMVAFEEQMDVIVYVHVGLVRTCTQVTKIYLCTFMFIHTCIC